MTDRSERVDVYILEQADFARPVLEHLRELFHEACPDITETIKWGLPYFEHKGMIGGFAAFKTHVSVGFWKGKLMADPDGLFEGVGSTQMSALKVAKLQDLPSDEVMLAYIREAVKLNESGVKLPNRKPSERPALEIPNDLQAALEGHAPAQAVFTEFSYSNQRDYVEWITEAKREPTRVKRLSQAIEWIAEGKPRNWKYMKKYQSD